MQGKDMLRDLHMKADQLQSAGKSIAKAHEFLAFLLPSMTAGLLAVGLPTESQLNHLLASGQTQELAAGAAAIIDAIAPIQHDERFDQVRPHPPRSLLPFFPTSCAWHTSEILQGFIHVTHHVHARGMVQLYGMTEAEALPGALTIPQLQWPDFGELDGQVQGFTSGLASLRAVISSAAHAVQQVCVYGVAWTI